MNKILAAIGAASAGVLPSGDQWTLRTVNRNGYTVEPTSYRQARRVRAKKGKQ